MSPLIMAGDACQIKALLEITAPNCLKYGMLAQVINSIGMSSMQIKMKARFKRNVFERIKEARPRSAKGMKRL